MVEIDLTKTTGNLEKAGELVKGTSKIKEIRGVIKEGRGLWNDIAPFLQNLMQGNQNRGKESVFDNASPVDQERAMQKQQPPAPPKSQGMDEQQMNAHFQTPEGIKQIIESIDKWGGFVGEDATLKDVKGLLQDILDGKPVDDKLKEKNK